MKKISTLLPAFAIAASLACSGADVNYKVTGKNAPKDGVAAIRDWEMPWIHLSDLKYWQTAAAGVYSVTAIPDNLLISPDGTVVARGLRGAALEAMLAEIFK